MRALPVATKQINIITKKQNHTTGLAIIVKKIKARELLKVGKLSFWRRNGQLFTIYGFLKNAVQNNRDKIISSKNILTKFIERNIYY